MLETKASLIEEAFVGVPLTFSIKTSQSDPDELLHRATLYAKQCGINAYITKQCGINAYIKTFTSF